MADVNRRIYGEGLSWSWQEVCSGRNYTVICTLEVDSLSGGRSVSLDLLRSRNTKGGGEGRRAG